jgi:AraC family transcriptional regulator, regulatory protein of adaptative response / methylphosphotriester-DNA alkyltransferase methyltransferase
MSQSYRAVADRCRSGDAPIRERAFRRIILAEGPPRTGGVQRSNTIRHRASLFEDATEIVESEYESDLSLDDIARRVASSRRQLQRAYAEIGRTTFREHLTAVRMSRAADLLQGRPMTVREVAQRVGYRQPAQFAKAFRRAMGASPSAWRERADSGSRDGAPRHVTEGAPA